MMKKSILFLITAGMLIMTNGCLTTDLSGQEKETRDLKPFVGIGIAISADVIYTIGNTHQMIIEGNQGDVRDLITRVEGGMLKLKYDNWRVKRSKLTIHITSRELEKVSVSGSAKFNSTKPVNAEEMRIVISGSGDIQFSALESEEVDVKISGSGNTILDKGSAGEMDVKISGSGKVLAEQFDVSEFSATISGSGSCKITVKKELDAKISGSGSIYYHGNPQVKSSSSGSGKVRSL